MGLYIAALQAAKRSSGAFSLTPPALRPVRNTFFATAAAIFADTLGKRAVKDERKAYQMNIYTAQMDGEMENM